MNNLKLKVAKFIRSQQLLSADGLHLVALSGGADSVALMLVLKALGYRIEAVHCNFHLRGEESDRDEQFVKRLSNRENIPLHLIHFDTREYAALHQVSIEMAARDLRYHYFSAHFPSSVSFLTAAYSASLSRMCAFARVLTPPGEIAFTVTPRPPRAFARYFM